MKKKCLSIIAIIMCLVSSILFCNCLDDNAHEKNETHVCTYKDYVCTCCAKIDPLAPDTTEQLEFEPIEENGEVVGYSVMGSSESCELKYIKIPTEHNGKPIIRIDCFAYHYDLISFYIPDTVTGIAEGAFYDCFSLCSVTIPKSVVTIAWQAFVACPKLTIYCETESKPDGWSENWNFGGYENFGHGKTYYPKSPVIWNYLKNNESEEGILFQIIDGVRYALIPKNLNYEIVEYDDNHKAHKTKITDGAVIIGQSGTIESIDVPDSVIYNDVNYAVKAIDMGAFVGCYLLKTVKLPRSLEYLGQDCFYYCEELKDLTFSGTIEQWNAIDKFNYGDSCFDSYTIHCTDGDIVKN